MSFSDPLTAFVESACVRIGPGQYSHQDGALDKANEILQAHPDLPATSLYAAAILGDDLRLKEALAQEPSAATTKGGPRNWDPLTYLCFSNYLRLDRARSDGFVRSTALLLNAGADANSGFFEASHQPEPVWESVLYGAAGSAQHPGVTQLLIDHGADPNDPETPYHSTETYDNTTLKILIGSGKLTPRSFTIMLVRKADWHDYDGMELLLRAGADPNHMSIWGFTPLHQSIRRDNRLRQIDLLLDHGADPTITSFHDGLSPASVAIRRGRADVLASLKHRGILPEPKGAERLIYACAMNDSAAVRQIIKEHPEWVEQVKKEGPTLLAEFAGTANADGVRQLLDLGIPVNSLYGGDAYFGIPPKSTALHVAAWKAWPNAVSVLIERGAPIDQPDGYGRTALQLAVRAATNSYWTNRRSTDSIKALLDAGASIEGIPIPTGYDEADTLLRAAGAA
ncbi:MAG: ankryin [Bacteroidota bacterium]|nr:ankryin [Bacteroidota bacterium]MDP4260617.1 ankryin [Bacteroidota bacterium]